ncbi:hypothetical protein [Pseudoxanthomonas sp. SE1]|uniref:hypothetical protein n=1 Tax=Pseudoxanthomonas sp. SE1 TaxID=1664560 RepID=UPI00240CF805|nr:hypothetical protein [Pseudoxanthomonas sp. SE1]WFC41352.1 hypothetical protein OY559_16415 [Pseudoxanthomonas sp. SE1]
MDMRNVVRGCIVAGAVWMAAAYGNEPVAPPETPPEVLETLLDREAPAAERDAAMQQLVAHAQAGDGYSAFYLGALYRHGMDHPARRVERDVETARFWLEKCVASARCPLIALASLAELELAAGNAKPAMQWAQAWVVLDREREARTRGTQPHRNTADAPYRNTAYHAYLISRCYKAMPKGGDQEAVGRSWFDELREARGTDLDRMLFTQLDGHGSKAVWGATQLEIAAENQREKFIAPDARIPLGPSFAFFLYRANPEGGRGEVVTMIEGLPTPASARGLEAQARSMRMKPYPLPEDGRRAYALLPVSYDDGSYTLVPSR